MHAFALLVAPLVSVAEDVGFDLLAGEDDVEESVGVFQAAQLFPGSFFSSSLR